MAQQAKQESRLGVWSFETGWALLALRRCRGNPFFIIRAGSVCFFGAALTRLCFQDSLISFVCCPTLRQRGVTYRFSSVVSYLAAPWSPRERFCLVICILCSFFFFSVLFTLFYFHSFQSFHSLNLFLSGELRCVVLCIQSDGSK